jgi:hypothetical protein
MALQVNGEPVTLEKVTKGSPLRPGYSTRMNANRVVGTCMRIKATTLVVNKLDKPLHNIKMVDPEQVTRTK